MSAAVKSYKRRTSLGSDLADPEVYNTLLDAILEQMADLGSLSYELGTWPLQVMLSIMGLHMKPLCGDRAIASTAQLYRFSVKTRTTSIREYDRDHAAW